jgi:hypothetical protein
MAWFVMPSKSELSALAPAQQEEGKPPIKVESKPTFPATMVCDLAECSAFAPNFGRTHVPVLAAFGGDRLHRYGMPGSWDLDRAISENANVLFRSIRRYFPDERQKKWDDLTFQFGPRSFLYVDEIRIMGYAETPQEAERLVTKFSETYHKPPVPNGGSFYLITTGKEISIETVPLGAETLLGDEAFTLHYGDGSREWHLDFTGKVRASNHGLSIFEGTPGTGKTSYLRHLMGVLKNSHRFYFIPTATMDVLSDPEFIGFWANQRRNYSDRQFVVILEDSDAALMTRGAENRDKVSAILNLSDGMLADFLRLQIICTINCRADDIDQALLRPGRLLCHRVFRRLDYPQASRLAESLGRKLPVVRDYSLAEVFAGDGSEEINRPRIGFAA